MDVASPPSASAPEKAESSRPLRLRIRERLRHGLLRLLRAAGMTWLLVFCLHAQSGFVLQGGLLHPVERFVEASGLDVDAFTVVLGGVVTGEVEAGLAGLKSLLSGVRERVERRADAPRNWELHADVGDGFEVVWYEGRSAAGVHWVLTAYRNGSDSPRVVVRREGRQFVAGVREMLRTLRHQVQIGVGNPVVWDVPRLVVSGRIAEAAAAHAPEEVLERIAEEVLAGEVRRWFHHESADEAAIFSPYLRREAAVDANLYLHVMREGRGLRVTLGTPTLAGIETALIIASAELAHNAAESEQTTPEEVR